SAPFIRSSCGSLPDPLTGAGPSAVILLVLKPASDARSRTLVVTPVPGGAPLTSAVILFVRRPASDARSRTPVVTPVSGGAAVTRVSGRRVSESAGEVESGTVNRITAFCTGTLIPVPVIPVG